ncbi:hypothetical protein BD410DRAFT_819988 [Rickenella mellea]|uniref:Condensation domain-containing protein n=1 Tax=Rickenella mellea TaxID=50990 RepID=A0A4Y7QDJ1_9AGAM|nr:hypothetical protein BD410DRAFT_819988 [Rickenella mellea]
MSSPLGWSSDPSHEVYRRPLGNTELGFYWDSVFSGTADTIQHVEVDVTDDHHDHFSQENVRRSWLYMKTKYPLLGCTVEEAMDSQLVEFVIPQRFASELSDVEFRDVNSWAAVRDFVNFLANGPRQLSSRSVSRLWVFRRVDLTNHFHIVILVAHLITDGIANLTIVRTFLDTLCSNHQTLPSYDLREKLSNLLPLESLHPVLNLTTPKRRWRIAIARVLFDLKQAKLQGGHTLPRVVTNRTPITPAQSKHTNVTLPKDISRKIIEICKKAGVTFGNALSVLSQIGHSRVLHKQHTRGHISDDEWMERKKQPMLFGGPLNLRPYLSREWYEAGGGAEVCLAISFFFNKLPFMPTSEWGAGNWYNDTPSFPDLLSRERFFLRCRIVKHQTISYMRHPLFLELALLRTPARVDRARNLGLLWREAQLRREEPRMDDLPVAGRGVVFANGGSSMGNIDTLIPLEYPLPEHGNLTTDQKDPMLRISHREMHLRCRPAELYLGANTWKGQLNLFVYWDGNVYDESLVKDWLLEIRQAAEWYLAAE